MEKIINTELKTVKTCMGKYTAVFVTTIDNKIQQVTAWIDELKIVIQADDINSAIEKLKNTSFDVKEYLKTKI